jgi:tetratricopeptide (TPR) repeat protein
MMISACLIVKDDSELSKLKSAVASFEEYVEEICITANGDKVEQIEAWCKTQPKIKYSYLKWGKDFSEQRNYNFLQADNKADWIFWVDADDVLIGGENLRSIAKAALNKRQTCVYFEYWYGCQFEGEPSAKTLTRVEIKHMKERLISPKKMVWQKRIHENPVHLEGLDFRYAKQPYTEELPIAILHLGAPRAESEGKTMGRTLRNKELLELELEDERQSGQPDPRTILYLMKIYKELDEPEILERCILLGHEYLQLSGWDMERASACELMGQCAQKLGRVDEAEDFYLRAVKEYPNYVILYMRLAALYFSKKDYSKMKWWMEKSLQMDEDDPGNQIDNVLEKELLSAELLMNYYWNVSRNTKKAYKVAQQLEELNPTEQNKENTKYLKELSQLDEACEWVDKLSKYLVRTDEQKAVVELMKALPNSISMQPFAIGLYNKYVKPKVWASNEICYYANFNQKHFEEWSGLSLERGIGGSETAVIQLSKEWAKNGYKVYVYCDPGGERGLIDGVYYLPWYYFNPKDKFNIFIQWRSGFMSNIVSSKKFYVDLHDVWNEADYLNRLDSIDGFFVKSKYHRSMGPSIPDEKFIVVSNGVSEC